MINALRHVCSMFGCAGRSGSAHIASVGDPAAWGALNPAGEAGSVIGIIAGNGSFPLRFAREAKQHGCKVVAVCYIGEAASEIEQLADQVTWIKVGELGKMIRTFKDAGVKHAAMAGGINRVRLFGGIKLDARGAAMIFRLRSTKDDVVMRGVAEEMALDGIEVIDCTIFLKQCLVRPGVLTKSAPTQEELNDIEVGKQAIKAMSSQDIGQLVVVREGVVVAVEAVEGTDAAIKRGGELGGAGSVVVKFAKPTQDMRFDVPIVGVKTVQSMIEANVRVLALEAGRCLILDEADVVELANRNKIAIIGCEPLV